MPINILVKRIHTHWIATNCTNPAYNTRITALWEHMNCHQLQQLIFSYTTRGHEIDVFYQIDGQEFHYSSITSEVYILA